MSFQLSIETNLGQWMSRCRDCEGRAGEFADALEAIGNVRLAAGDPRRALEVAERGLATDPLNEVLWRLALEAEGRLGPRQAIEVRYERLCRMLGERLGRRWKR